MLRVTVPAATNIQLDGVIYGTMRFFKSGNTLYRRFHC
jgi:hypothetical protein